MSLKRTSWEFFVISLQHASQHRGKDGSSEGHLGCCGSTDSDGVTLICLTAGVIECVSNGQQRAIGCNTTGCVVRSTAIKAKTIEVGDSGKLCKEMIEIDQTVKNKATFTLQSEVTQFTFFVKSDF